MTDFAFDGHIPDEVRIAVDSYIAMRQRVESHDMPIQFQAAMTGEIAGHVAHFVQIMGSRTLGWSSTAVYGDTCEYLDTSQAAMNTPAVGQSLYVVSTSANDTAAGTGVRSVRIVYLDASGLERTVDVAMNGTTPVPLGAGFTAIQWMESKTAGSGGVAAGAIAVTSTNGPATVATTFELIAAAGNRSLSGRYKVPSDCTGYLMQWHCSAISNTMDTRLRGDFMSDDNSLSPGVFHFLGRNFLASGQTQDIEGHFRKIPAGATLKISAMPGGAPAGNKLDCDFSLICIKD